MNKVLNCVFFIFLTLACHFAIAQSTDDNLVKLADEMYGFGDKKDALGVYLQALEINPENVLANYMAGRCYLETVQKELSVTYLIKAYTLKTDVSPDILFKIGNGYQLGGKFEEAIEYYKKYKQILNDETALKLKSTIKDEIIKTDRKVYECMNGREYAQVPQNYKIENIRDIVNSEYPDYAPAVSSDNSLMIFTSRRGGGVGKNKDVDNEYFEDVWYTMKVNGEWIAPRNMGKPINTETHDASIGLSKNGKELFIYKADNGGDIFICKQLKDGSWSTPDNMGRAVNTKYNEPSVSISSDEKTLYFSSDRPGGFGGLDIYKAEKEKDGSWGKVVNLGSTINTEYDDDSPFIDADGKTLYFSSRGHKGIGGFDIYKAEFEPTKKAWTQPINMGYPVNSSDDDIYFVITGDGKVGYFASAKTDGYGDKDIYKIFLKPEDEVKKDSALAKTTINVIKKDSVIKKTIQKAQIKDIQAKRDSLYKKNDRKEAAVENEVVTEKAKSAEQIRPIYHPTILHGKIADFYSGNPLSAKVVINDLKGNVVNVLDVGSDGHFTTEISQSRPAKFSVTVTKEGYIYSNLNVFVPANSRYQKTVKRDFALKKIGIGEVFILRNIYYDFDRDEIKRISWPYLDKLVAWMKSHSKVHLEIGGHTDNYGLDRYNKILSQKRVDAVVRYVSAKGIDVHRVVAIGYGEERPLATNDDEQEGREINRRTEFKITRK